MGLLLLWIPEKLRVRAVLFGLFPVWGYSGYVPGDTGYETYCYLWTLILTGLWRSWWVFRSSLKLLHSMKKLGRMWNNIFSHCYQLCCRVWFSLSVRPYISSTGQTPSKTEAGVVQKDLFALGDQVMVVRYAQVSTLFVVFAWGDREAWRCRVPLIELRGTKGRRWLMAFDKESIRENYGDLKLPRSLL